MESEVAILFVAYGSPDRLEDVEPYFAHIRGGRTPTPQEVEALRRRYAAVGGRTPLLDITRRQASGAERRLREGGFPVRAFVGMRHWHPFVHEAVDAIAEARLRRILVIPLAPFYSSANTDGYRQAVQDAVGARDFEMRFVSDWHDSEPLFEAWAAILRGALAARPLDGHLLFTAHSLPRSRLPPDDPYERELRTVAGRLANAIGAPSWSLAFQSVGMAGGAWLGPEAVEVVDELAAKGTEDLLVAPLGFVAENLETLYDLDLELARRAAGHGIAFRRTPTPDVRTEFVAALEGVAAANLRAMKP